MTKDPGNLVRLGFERDCVEIPLENIRYVLPLPVGIKDSVKYRQIRCSVHAIGLVEPVVVAPNRLDAGFFDVLDGRMRLEVLRDMGVQRLLCLISTDDEGYSYNKLVNRLSVVQSHRMVVHAVERGASVQQLAEALDVSVNVIREKFRLLDGISREVVAMLADKPATSGMFKVLKNMKPFRQIDVAQAMINLGNYSIKLASAMLSVTPPDQLTETANAKAQRGTPTEALQRLERELAAVQADTKLLEEGYGPSNLQLEIVKTYIGVSLLRNVNVVRWLATNRAEYLQQLQRIAEIKELPN